MHDLTAQVTSSLLPFSGVTLDALGEDEISLDCVLHGKFTVERSGLAWLASGANLEVVHAVTGERLSAYCFSGGGENPPVVLAARDFSWLKRSGLLVGLEETEGSVLCLYDLGLSRVVKAVVIPGRITAIEPLVSYGGASTSTQHLHQSLRWFFGIAAVVTDLGHVLLVDLCLDDLSCSQSELEASDLQVVTKSPEDIPRLREVGTRQGRHLCLQLNSPSGVGVTALQYIPRTNQLAVGFSDGHLQLWNMKSLKKEYHSQLEGGRVSVYAFTFQEPENDPRNCCYLWAVQSSQDLEGDLVSLHLLQLAFSERKCLTSGKILYEGLEYCEERYSQDLSGTSFPLRAQASNTRLLSCQTIEKFRAHPDRDDSMNEVASPDTSLSIFCWQVKAYGQGSPSTYIGVFDINRWYHAQMPDSLRTGESLQDCPYLAVWSLDSVVQMVSPHSFLDVVVHERSLSRGLPFTCPPPEQYFNPTTYNFDATCLLNTGIVHLTCTGHQKETLSFLKKAAPCSSDIISIGYSQCLMSGLLSSRVSDAQAANLSQEEQLDAILSTAVETSSLGMITGCIKQWTAEEQPGSALNLRYILDWAWNKVVQTKEELDGICAPLFDSSTNFTDSQTLQLLQHTQRLLSNLSAIFHCMLSEAQELTQQGLAGLMNKNMVSSLISKYAQVVLWFCRTGLLPEGSDEDALQIPRPFFTHSVISSYYSIRREELAKHAKSKWCADCLMIDGLVGQCGESLTDLWKRDEGGTGQYPPPTLHALLDLYLLDNIDEATKHAIVIYLLLDVMYSFPNKDGTSVESFPTAFAIPIGLVKLVQGLWLLDHHDHQSSFDLLLHPAASQFHFEWQHERVLQALMCQGQQSVALRYFHVTKPPITSTGQAKLCLSVLLHNRCLVEAWCLLRQHTNGLDFAEMLGFLYESCQELGLIKELLKLPLGLNEQDCLEKFLQGTGGLQNRELLMVHYLQQANYIPALQLNQTLKMNLVNERDPKLKERSTTRNAIMDQYGKVLPRVQRKLAVERAKPYQHPSTVRKEVSRPQPLSTITKRSANEKVMSRAGFIDNVLSKIQEVWLGKDATPQSSPAKTPNRGGAQSSTPRPSALSVLDPFLGTPITMTSKRRSRLMDLVVHPSCQSPRPLLSPPRPPSSLVSPKSTRRAPELTLLQTPQVVKRARALAASGPVFSAFTPQSILRSSLRPTPVATPSASPGRSVTPPLRSKESRITFIEEAEARETEKGIRWTNGMAADSEISQLSRGPKATRKTWSLRPAKEEEEEEEEEEVHPRVKFLPPDGGVPSPPLRCSEREPSFTQEETAEANPPARSQTHLSVNFDTSQISVQSTDTTLEYYDAPLSEDPNMAQGRDVAEDDDDDDDVVTLNIKHVTEKEPEGPKRSDMTPEESFNLTSADTEKEEEFLEEAGLCEEVAEGASDLKVHEEEGAASDREESLDTVSTSKREDVASPEEEEPTAHHEAGHQVTESSGPEVRPEEQLVKSDELNAQWEAAELNVEKPKASEESVRNEAARDQDLTTDLTEFVDQQLFGEALSPPLSRSAIHSASLSQTSLNSECLGEEEEEPPAVAPSAFTTQKSTISLTSSEPTGTDSHSVVSVNDSEELSSPDSEDDGEEEEESSSNEGEEEEDEEEEAEDSGSEVEIIDEVQGNGRLPPLQPSSVFMQQEQEHPHFLQELSEQQAAAFSLITPDAEMKIVGEDMEGEVVMVRLGDDDGGLEQGSSYMELKPPTTLLVPFEFMEGQQSPTDGSDLAHPGLQPSVMADEQQPEVLTNFTLMLEGDKDGAEEAPAVGNDLLLSELPAQPHVESEDLLDKPDVFPLDPDHMEEASEEEQKENLDHNDVRGLGEEAELQTEFTAAKLEAEDSAGETNLKSEEIRRFSEDQDSVPGELPAVVNDSDSKTEAVEAEVTAEDKAAPDEEAQPPEGNGPVDTEMEKTEPAEENLRRDRITSSDTDVRPEEETEEKPRSEEETEEKPRSEEETEEKPRSEEETEEKPSRRLRHQTVKQEPVEQVVGSDSQPEKQTPLTKKAPSTPTRRLTRGRRVAFSSSLPEAADEPQQDGNAEFEKTNSSVSASPTRLPRKGPPLQTVTPRRSSRISQSEPPKEEAEDFASASKTPSSGRRSQSATATRAGSKEKPAATEVEITEDRQEDEVVETRSRRASSKTPSKPRTAQAATPRRSSRRTTSGGEVEPTPLEAGKEEDPVVPPVKRSARKVRPEVLPILFEEEEEKKKQQLSSPGRTTRQSSRITLNVYPQTNRKTAGTAPEEVKESKDLLQSDSNKSAGRSNSRRPSRRGLWDHPEEDLPLLDSPLEVDSETPVADALIKRLQDEEEKQEIKTERTRKRSTKASEEQISSQPPVKDGAVPEPAEDESSPGESSFIYSPSRRRQTRAHNAESPAPSEDLEAPVTRSRRRGRNASLQDKVSSEEDHAEVEKTSKSRKANQKTAKSRAVPESVPIAKVNPISPLPSPTNLLPLALKRITDGEVPAATRNPRRKRLMDTVFSKPVTRRRKL
ncbi:protein ELYS isoform X2 [Fundulus heteroclitus]|uniref:protein ELYS isoform X2 n=1 Tax=Fundulus heteroclitus TaxID=8078 RepID=UPI00165B9DC7|nr:protein ELYS isoform X2 [Fundulus heteroclitus]